jgi:hypothetical protein
MVRQILVSTPPAAPVPSEGPDLGRWLTQELRAKGSSLSSPPPPATEPSAPEVPRAPLVVDEESPLVGWLAQDLTPKHSVRPASSLPALYPAPGAPDAQEFSAPEVSAGAETVASLQAPQAVLASEPVPASTPVPPTLEEDDFSVLPGRRRAPAGSGRKKYAVLLLGLMLLGGALVLRLRGGADLAQAGASSGTASAADGAGALPPPPGSGALEAPPEETVSAPVGRGAGAREQPAELTDPRDPRFSLGGPNVRRYADVPSPTLSRLAREQRRLAREREEAARNAKPAAKAERSSKR